MFDARAVSRLQKWIHHNSANTDYKNVKIHIQMFLTLQYFDIQSEINNVLW